MASTGLEDIPFAKLATEILCRAIHAEGELAEANRRSDRWQKLAGHYDDIRYWLRACSDDEAGHAQFYKECCLLIFREYGNQSLTEDGELITAPDESEETDAIPGHPTESEETHADA